MKKREKLKKFLFNKPDKLWILIANVIINISWVFLLGLFINKSLVNTLIIIVVWSLSLRMGKAKHYSSPLKCFLMQVLLFSSIFLSTYINIYVAVVFTVYAKFMFSGWADIDDVEPEKYENPSFKDLTFWKGQTESSVHQPLIDYLKYNAITDANSQEEMEMLKKTAKEIAEM